MSSIDPTDAASPLVLAIDIGSSSVRALVYDRNGQQVTESETQLTYTQSITADGGSESDAARLFTLLQECLDSVVEFAGTHGLELAGVGASSFWHGLLGIDASGQPTTPVYMWSDKRSGKDALSLASEIDPIATHQATGCRLHSSYWPAKLRWLARERPDQVQRVSHWVSVTDYLTLQLFGELETSVSMASGTGLLSTGSLDWEANVANAAGIDQATLPPIVDRHDARAGLVEPWASRWPSLAQIPWYPAIGDGAAANVGAGCVGRSRIAMTIGTSAAMRLIVPDESNRVENPLLPARIWSYRLDRDHRVLGGALSNGGNVTRWLADHLADGDFDQLTDAAAAMGPDAHGLTMLPFLAGERSPSWNDHATGTISGVRLATTGGDLFRVTLESTAYRLAAIYDDLRTLAAPGHEIHANGAAALSSPLWLQIIADTLGHRIDAVDAEAEASARGAAVCALEALFEDMTLDRFGHALSLSYEPDAAAHQVYVLARSRQSRLEDAINMAFRP